jgi:hypothetical protein
MVQTHAPEGAQRTNQDFVCLEMCWQAGLERNGEQHGQQCGGVPDGAADPPGDTLW